MQIKKSQKLNLAVLNVQSFVTSEALTNKQTVKGGSIANDTSVVGVSNAVLTYFQVDIISSESPERCTLTTTNVSRGSGGV